MSEKILIREARRRREIFKNLQRYLDRIRETVKSIDKEARVYLFGSVARGEHVLISDIDVLIVSRLEPSRVIASLREAGFEEPFEFHVVDEERAELYLQMVKDLREI